MAGEVKQALAAYMAAKDELTEANRVANEARKAKAEAQRECVQALEREELDSAKAGDVLASRYELAFAKLENRELFKEWAKDEDEAYFEPEPRVDESKLNGLVRRLLDDGQPLPPGLGVWFDERISLTKVTK